jgi:phosphatidate cytidylyltransferase
MTNVIQRTLTGAVYTALIISSLVIHPLFFAGITLILNFTGLLELQKIGRRLQTDAGIHWVFINSILFALSVILIYLQTTVRYFEPLLLLFILLLILPIYEKKADPFSTLQFSVFGSLYISIPLIIINLIHKISLTMGIPFTLAMFIIIWTNDTFAYLTGMAIGKHRLFEKLSPKKSWEGFFGGLLMGILAAVIFDYFFPEPGIIFWIAYAIIACIASVFGDFVESLLKRNADVKDSGRLLPGHGGILDRIDSLLLAGPAIYFLLVLLY